ncbi:MAG: cation transporter [Gammaproteobacteria bacterium]
MRGALVSFDSEHIADTMPDAKSPNARTALTLAVLANLGVCLGELALGWRANSLAVIVDAVHNGADEIALVCLLLACRHERCAPALRRLANLLNTAGIAVIAASIAVLAAQRMLDAPAVAGELTLAAGLAAALGNTAVALALRKAARGDAAVRLAYLHNVGDVALCLTTACAGAAIVLTGRFWIDAGLAFVVAAGLLVATWRALSRPVRVATPASSNALLMSDN